MHVFIVCVSYITYLTNIRKLMRGDTHEHLWETCTNATAAEKRTTQTVLMTRPVWIAVIR